MKTVTLLLATICAPWASAQEPASPGDPVRPPKTALRTAVPPRGVVPIHTAPDDPVGGAYGIWAAGDDYKVSFHGDPTFVPYLGADYPRNQPWSWSTRCVSVGNRVIVDGSTPVVRRYEGARCEYRRGAVVEAYDVLASGLEQTFVLAQHPGVAGDLVIAGEVTTDLHPLAQFHDEHRAVDYGDDRGSEILSYGEAFALDAAGQKEPIATSVVGSRITLRVPGSFLADATYPVTVDPLVGSRTIGATRTYNVDVARNDLDNRTLFAWISYSSASDRDAYAWSYDDNLTAGANVYADVTTNWSTPEITCCHVGTPTTNKWLAALQRDFTSSTGIRIWAQDAGLTTLGTVLRFVVTAFGQHDRQPDCGGVEAFDQSGQTSAGSHGMVTWQRDFSTSGSRNTNATEIFAVPFDCTSRYGTLGGEFRVSPFGSFLDAQYPSINKVSAGNDGASETVWMIAYQKWDNSVQNRHWEVNARSVTSTRQIGPRWRTSDHAGESRITPKIEGQRGRYLVCFGQLLSTTHTNRTDANTIEVERLDYDRAPVNGPFRQHRIGGRTSTSGQLIARDVAYDADTDSHWIATWSAENVGIAFSHIGFEGWPLVYEFARRGGATAWDGTAVYNDDAKRFTCGYTYFYSNGIGAGFYEYPPEPTSPSMTGAGCSPATLRWNGRDSQGNSVPANDQQIGNEFSTCDVTGMPSGALSVLAVGTGFQNSLIRHPVVPSNCLLLVRDYSLLPLQIGSTHRAQISLPSFLPGGWRVFVQCWHTNAAGTQFLGTRRLEVPVYK